MRWPQTRLALTVQAGYDSWDQALADTMHLSCADAGLKLGISARCIYRDRIRVGLATVTKRPSFDPDDRQDPLHGSHRGYRRGCRCVRCRSAYNAKNEQVRRRRADAQMLPSEHGIYGYTGYFCRCEVCCAAHLDYKRQWGLRPKPEVTTHDSSGYAAGCRCTDCRTAVGRPFQARRGKIGLGQHGTQSTYRKGCRCPECSAVESERKKEYRRRRKAQQTIGGSAG